MAAPIFYESNEALVYRFINDYKLPIQYFDPLNFDSQLELFEADYQSFTKWSNMVDEIRNRFHGDAEAFLNAYYRDRDKIITNTQINPAFEAFNNGPMDAYVIKDKPKIPKTNIYNEENNGKTFISIDMKQANFHALRKVNPDIVFGADTYEEFLEKGADIRSPYIKGSKYFREVVFGQLNPSRHITVEKYYIVMMLKNIINSKEVQNLCPLTEDNAVFLSNDEIIFSITKPLALDIWEDLRNAILACSIDGFEFRVELFKLEGYSLWTDDDYKERKKVTDGYVKIPVHHVGGEKLCAVPLPFFNLFYKGVYGIPYNADDRLIKYDKVLTARFEHNFITKKGF